EDALEDGCRSPNVPEIVTCAPPGRHADGAGDAMARLGGVESSSRRTSLDVEEWWNVSTATALTAFVPSSRGTSTARNVSPVPAAVTPLTVTDWRCRSETWPVTVALDVPTSAAEGVSRLTTGASESTRTGMVTGFAGFWTASSPDAVMDASPSSTGTF